MYPRPRSKIKFTVISGSDPNYCQASRQVQVYWAQPSVHARSGSVIMHSVTRARFIQRSEKCLRPSDPFPPSEIVRGLPIHFVFRWVLDPWWREREASEESHSISGVSDTISDRLH